MIEYTMKNRIDLGEVDEVMVEKMHFFHSWSFYNMMGLDIAFLREIFSHKHSFASLFKKELKIAQREAPFFIKDTP